MSPASFNGTLVPSLPQFVDVKFVWEYLVRTTMLSQHVLEGSPDSASRRRLTFLWVAGREIGDLETFSTQIHHLSPVGFVLERINNLLVR